VVFKTTSVRGRSQWRVDGGSTCRTKEEH